MKDPIPMTPPGLQKLKDELKLIKSVERPKNIEDIERARAQGDLSENAEYEAAKDRQGYLAARMGQLEDAIARAQVIDPTQLKHEKVVFGATVRSSDCESGDEVTYQIVGPFEADLKIGRISVESPIARSFIGKTVGDIAKFSSPKGTREFEILEIIYK